MSLLDRFKRRLNKADYIRIAEEVRKSIGSEFYSRLLQNVQNNPVYMDANIEAYINQGYLFNPTVYSIVSFIAQKASTIPFGVYQVKNEKALTLYKSASADLPQFKKELIRTKALVEVEDHELNSLFLNPNELQSWNEFIEQVVGFKLITGNTYIHCIGPTSGVNKGLLKEMWVLPSQRITVVAGDRMKPVKQYEYLGDRGIVIQPEEIIHLKYWTPNADSGQFLYGVSPIQAGRRVITRSNSSFDASVSLFQNMGTVGILSPDPSVGATEMTEEQQDALEKTFKKKTGPNNAGRPVISGMPLKWQQTAMSPVDLAIIESDKMDLRTICNLFHVPAELFNDSSNKTYSNMKEAGSAVYTNAIIPALTQFRDALNKFIRPKYNGQYFIDYDVSMISELQDDLAMMTTALAGAWWISPNERRDIMSFGADENNPMMDMYWVPAGYTPMEATQSLSDQAVEEAAKFLGI